MTREPGETFYAFLGRRKQELEHRIAAVRSELEALETELTHVKSAHRQVSNLGGDNARFGTVAGLGLTPRKTEEPYGLGISVPASYANQTIKQLIMRAFQVQFGARPVSSVSLQAFIRDGFGRDIDRNSLAPQLSRLKADGLIESVANGKWRITRKGQLAGFDRLEDETNYGHVNLAGIAIKGSSE